MDPDLTLAPSSQSPTSSAPVHASKHAWLIRTHMCICRNTANRGTTRPGRTRPPLPSRVIRYPEKPQHLPVVTQQTLLHRGRPGVMPTDNKATDMLLDPQCRIDGQSQKKPDKAALQSGANLPQEQTRQLTVGRTRGEALPEPLGMAPGPRDTCRAGECPVGERPRSRTEQTAARSDAQKGMLTAHSRQPEADGKEAACSHT